MLRACLGSEGVILIGLTRTLTPKADRRGNTGHILQPLTAQAEMIDEIGQKRQVCQTEPGRAFQPQV